MNINDIISAVQEIDTLKRYGRVKRVVGLLVESEGPATHIGEVCYIHAASNHMPILAEVVGFSYETIILMPYAEVTEIGPGCLVEATGQPLMIKVGKGLIGHVIDPLGNRLDGMSLPNGLINYATERTPPNPMSRKPIDEPIQVGVKAIDAMLTVGKGQRIGIFAGSGVGKSTLLGMIARSSNADINVIALVGERGREVREFIERDLGSEGLKRTIVVAATSDQPALMRIKGAYTATSISEYFRDQGYNVNLMMDSVTRVAMAQREIGLATGEPPTTKGYTPSVFAILPKLLERTGASSQGTITAFYTVLVDGDDMNDPIADTVRGILDGHFILSRKIAERGQYPPIDVLQSVSRAMHHMIDKKHKKSAEQVRSLIAFYEENKDLIQIGAYKAGTDHQIDRAITYYPKINQFLQQEMNEHCTFEMAVKKLKDLL